MKPNWHAGKIMPCIPAHVNSWSLVKPMLRAYSPLVFQDVPFPHHAHPGACGTKSIERYPMLNPPNLSPGWTIATVSFQRCHGSQGIRGTNVVFADLENLWNQEKVSWNLGFVWHELQSLLCVPWRVHRMFSKCICEKRWFSRSVKPRTIGAKKHGQSSTYWGNAPMVNAGTFNPIESDPIWKFELWSEESFNNFPPKKNTDKTDQHSLHENHTNPRSGMENHEKRHD